MGKIYAFIIGIIIIVGSLIYFASTECLYNLCDPGNEGEYIEDTFVVENDNDKYDEIESNPLDRITTVNTVPKQENTKESTNQTITPGPLKVLKNLVSPNPASLSSEGIVEWTNFERNSGLIPSLIRNSNLDEAARMKVEDMFAQQYFEHVSPDGVGVDILASRSGYQYVVVGENLAMGSFKDEKTLVSAWMESPGHRANIMNSRFEEIGVYVRRGIFDGKEIWLAVQEFGKPLASCPMINPSLEQLIKANKSQTESLEYSLRALQIELEEMKPKWGDTYNKKVNDYNSLVGPFNELVRVTREMVNSYNIQVRKFNECATG